MSLHEKVHHAYATKRGKRSAHIVPKDFDEGGIAAVARKGGRLARTTEEAIEFGDYMDAASYFLAKKALNGGYSYCEMVMEKDFQVFLLYLFEHTPFGSTLGSQVQLHEHYHLATYENAGQKLFDVSPGLSEMLKATEVRGLKTSDILMPHEALYISAPKNNGFRIWNDETGWHPFEGVYVTLDEDIDATRDAEEEHRRHKPLSSSDTGLLRFMMIAGRKDGKPIRNIFDKDNPFMNPMDNSMFFFDLVVSPERDLGEEIKHQSEILEEIGYVEMKGVWEEVLLWTVNVLLYIVADNNEVEYRWSDPEVGNLRKRLKKAKGSKAKKLKDRIRVMDKRKIIYLGGSIKEDEGGSLGGVRTKVAGHHKLQPYGERWEKRKRIWLKPYWRGTGPVSNPVVRLK